MTHAPLAGRSRKPVPTRALICATALVALTACSPSGTLDWDLRGAGQGSTAEAAQRATAAPPRPDSRGVLSYPGYQVAQARRGDSVSSVAARVGLGAEELARANALEPGDMLRAGEILALPRRVGEGDAFAAAAPSGAPSGSVIGGPIDVTTIAGGAIDRAAPAVPAAAPRGPEPIRHRVARGETAYSVARTYNVSARALADWNGLGPDLGLREGQTLLIPTATGTPPQRTAAAATAPGTGTLAPPPPSAAQPLPAERTTPAAQTPRETPASPAMAAQRTATSAARMAMPTEGRIIRPYAKGRNDGIDIAAAAGSPVRAAADGTVAAITKDTDQVPIVVIRHEGNLLTVYANIDNVTVARGASVKRGQQFAVVRRAEPAFLHFEVRRGAESTDPMGFLQ
ncbi:MAG: peptidoglycan DD-metalloendopeptidase family protein [Gemmobacter sp.]